MKYSAVFIICLFSKLCMVLSDACPKIITRQKWGARNPLENDNATIPVENVIVHHTATSNCNTEEDCIVTMQSIQNYHMDALAFSDISYNFLAGGDGNIYEGRGWHKVGAHTYKYNSKSLGLGFIGHFEKELPNEKQLNAAKDLIRCALEMGEISKDYKLYGASQLRSTLSPGSALFKEIQNWPHFTKI